MINSVSGLARARAHARTLLLDVYMPTDTIQNCEVFMVDKRFVKSLRQKVYRFWRDGHISRNERDVAYKILDSDLVDSMDSDTLQWLLERSISFPLAFSSLGGNQ